MNEEYKKLKKLFENHDPEDLIAIMTHDGFKIYRDNDKELYERDCLWEWNVEFDPDPFRPLKTLLKEVGVNVETM